MDRKIEGNRVNTEPEDELARRVKRVAGGQVSPEYEANTRYIERVIAAAQEWDRLKGSAKRIRGVARFKR